jgi:uncharacterized membrane protein
MMMGVGFLALGLLLVAGLGLVFAATGYFSMRGADRGRSEARSGMTPWQILDERLARGEIEAEECERIAARIERG